MFIVIKFISVKTWKPFKFSTIGHCLNFVTVEFDKVIKMMCIFLY